MLTVIAFYTPEYDGEVQKLISSCKEHGQPIKTVRKESKGNWQKNTYMKPQFIMDMHDEVEGPLLYVDADAVINKSLELEAVGDVMIFSPSQEWLDKGIWNKSPDNRYLSGTMYFSNNSGSRAFCNLWIEESTKHPNEHGDQSLIRYFIDRYKEDNTVGELPIEYIKIFDKRVPCGEPFIIHNQASRRLKSVVNSGKAKLENIELQLGKYAYNTRKEVAKYNYAYQEEHMWSISSKVTAWALERFTGQLRNILDIGCGAGNLRGSVPHESYVGIDISNEILDEARKDATPSQSFVHGDVAQLEGRNADIVFCLDVLQLMPEDVVFNAIDNIVSCGGTQIISVQTKPDKRLRDDKRCTYAQLYNTPEWWVRTIGSKTKIHETKNLKDGTLIMFCGEEYRNIHVEIPFKVRRMRDGKIVLIRKDRQKEIFLDKHYDRLSNTLTWTPRVNNHFKIKNLKDMFKDQCVYVIGKGPSLDHLTADLFVKPGPILAINESVNKIQELDIDRERNKIYLLQQDPGLSSHPEDAVILHHRIKYLHPEIGDRMIFMPKDLGLRHDNVSGVVAVPIAKLMGASEIVFISFDAVTCRDIGYAECIGKQPSVISNKGPERFRAHGGKIKLQLGHMKHMFLQPSPP